MTTRDFDSSRKTTKTFKSIQFPSPPPFFWCFVIVLDRIESLPFVSPSACEKMPLVQLGQRAINLPERERLCTILPIGDFDVRDGQ
jgi:hypothetical protein